MHRIANSGHLLRFGLFSRNSDQTQLLEAPRGVALPCLHGLFPLWSTVTLICWFPHCFTSDTNSHRLGGFSVWGLISSPQRILEFLSLAALNSARSSLSWSSSESVFLNLSLRLFLIGKCMLPAKLQLAEFHFSVPTAVTRNALSLCVARHRTLWTELENIPILCYLKNLPLCHNY